MTSMMGGMSEYEVHQVALHRLKVGTKRIIPGTLRESLEVRVFEDFMQTELDAMVVELTGEIVAEKLPPEWVTKTDSFYYKVPASWWQMWKEQHADKWYARWIVARRPVRYEKRSKEVAMHVRIDRYWAYPEANIPLRKDLGRPVKYGYIAEKKIV